MEQAHGSVQAQVGQGCARTPALLGVALLHSTQFDLGISCVAMATAARTALIIPNPDSNPECRYHRINTVLQMIVSQMEP